ncbi:AraC family transcriptional regulator [Vreelandella venusta]|uniref:AraC family transcriptional regulator n=1 Tax=Vreelandella venusta TaxID=44935 RepID=A0AAP9ZHJ6_9GAMM|nr:AraC family transcriptional regulator [Halomonas venusta]MBR9925326.1 AraC family transcriptional regulator [Gammaproteobacteria bacterium]AZM95042.1 AraC family transcriptional regulator [Halomonas venusta]MDW0358352.1 AraC family transcriptional regulator [Halomonas venusta]NPT29545.1 AraC family transcriptional regulator CmrA [Halomonas venusta]QPI65077.1 AraC family transcriptional regulator [Halomonas venusta]
MTDTVPEQITYFSDGLPQQLSKLIRRWTPLEELQNTAIPEVQLIRTDAPTTFHCAVYEPCLCFVIQGSKTVLLGDKEIVYTGPSCIGSAVHLPIVGRIDHATPETPYLAVKVSVDPQEVAGLILELGDKAPPAGNDTICPETDCGLKSAPMDSTMLGALYRLLSLLDTPDDIQILSPLARRELIYRALMGAMGPHMRRFAASDSQANRIAKVICALKERYTQPFKISELAAAANMSESTLYHSFRQVTRMSPLQYQKKLRLHEARRLMLAEGLEAATASYRVGYESPSHFSREYSRMFGAPPRADVTQLRGIAAASQPA